MTKKKIGEVELTGDEVMNVIERKEELSKIIADAEKCIKEAKKESKKHEKSLARLTGRNFENKMKYILGAYILKDPKKFQSFIKEADFQAYLSDKDKEFMTLALPYFEKNKESGDTSASPIEPTSPIELEWKRTDEGNVYFSVGFGSIKDSKGKSNYTKMIELGAKWDKGRKRLYISSDTPLEQFNEWFDGNELPEEVI